MKSALLSFLILASLPLSAKDRPAENSALCRITTLFENPEVKKLHDQQLKVWTDSLFQGNEPDTQYNRDGEFWPEIREIIEMRTWMKVADFGVEPPKSQSENAGFVAFWESGMTPESQTIEAGPTQADAKSGHRVRFSLSISDSTGKVLWEKHSGWHFIGSTYTVTGTAVISGHSHSSVPNDRKILDGLAKQLRKEAGCR